ncbi:MAG: redoxin domain-containing protein [Prevotella sp.]
MKKTILTFLMGAASLTMSAQSEVTVTAQGLPDGTTVEAYLGATHVTEKPMASASVSGGQFTMTLPVEEPRYIVFGVKGGSGYFLNLMTGKGEHPSVTVDVEKEENDGTVWYQGKNVTVKNSPLQAEYELKIGGWHDALDRMYNHYHEAVAQPSASDSTFTRLEHEFFTTVERTYKRIAADNKDTWWGPFSMLNLYSYFSPDNKADWAQFSDAAKQSFYGQLLDAQINPKSFVGQSYTKFNILDAKGKTSKVESVVKGKKYLLIDFWASWCVPCRKEIPNLKDAYAKYKDKGLQIVSISLDRSDAAWKKALGEEKLPWPNGIDKSGIADSYRVQAIPAMFLVDLSTGNIIAENIRGKALQDKLAELTSAQ